MIHGVKGTALPLRAGCPTSYDTQANAPTACPEADSLATPSQMYLEAQTRDSRFSASWQLILSMVILYPLKDSGLFPSVPFYAWWFWEDLWAITVNQGIHNGLCIVPFLSHALVCVVAKVCACKFVLLHCVSVCFWAQRCRWRVGKIGKAWFQSPLQLLTWKQLEPPTPFSLKQRLCSCEYVSVSVWPSQALSTGMPSLHFLVINNKCNAPQVHQSDERPRHYFSPIKYPI